MEIGEFWCSRLTTTLVILITMTRRPAGPEVSDQPSPPRLGIILIDPQHLVRAGMTLIISTQPDLEVVAEAGSAEEGLQAAKELRRRQQVVAVIGTSLTGDQDVYWLIRAMREVIPAMRVLACAHRPDPNTISRALFSGADGVINKSVPPEEFIDALRRAGRGEVVLQGLPAGSLGTVALGIERQREEQKILTGREREVLTAAAEGLTARQIGKRLGVRERTVTTHLGHIYRKLGTPGRVSAISAAAKAGLVTIH
jgi:DNA-binding NarL/FixJ family response regulator